MGWTRIGIVIVGWTFALGQAVAEPMAPQTPVMATIADIEVEVRSGPTEKYDVTGIIRRNDRVQIHHADGDWLAIVPPNGSVSWVNHRFLSEMMNFNNGRGNAFLLQDHVEVRIGKTITTPPLGVKQLELPRGTIVEVIGAKMVADNSTWYPITPPDGEFRFIPKRSIGSPQPGEAIAARIDRAPNPNAPSGMASPIGRNINEVQPPAEPASRNPLWTRAEQLEASGDIAAAQQLYTQLAQELRQNNGDYELAVLCYNRINRLHERSRAIAASMTQPMASPFQTANNTNRSDEPIPPAARTTSAPRELPPIAVAPATRPAPNDRPEAAPNPGGVARLQSSGGGLLRRSGLQIDNRQAYVLESYDGRTRLYVTAQPGVNLEGYLNRYVELIGSVNYRGDIRGGDYMSVSRINVLR